MMSGYDKHIPTLSKTVKVMITAFIVPFKMKQVEPVRHSTFL
jgi:hypothetical protein